MKHAFSSHEKSVKLLDYEDNTTLRDGIVDMWNWAKKQPMRERAVMDYEIDKGMYSFWK